MGKRSLVIGPTLGALVVAAWWLAAMGTRLRIVEGEEPCDAPGCFESVSHYQYLYDGFSKIARVDEAAISPNSTYAVFGSEGKIMLYKRSDGHAREVTDGGFAIPESYQWDENHGRVVLTYSQDNPTPYYAHHAPSTIRLH